VQKYKAQTTLGDLHRATPWLWLHSDVSRYAAFAVGDAWRG
jgi:hypothetical protein